MKRILGLLLIWFGPGICYRVRYIWRIVTHTLDPYMQKGDPPGRPYLIQVVL